MRCRYPALLLLGVVLASLLLCGQDQSSASSSSSSSGRDSQSRKPAPPRRLTEAAKAAENEGEEFLFQKHDVKSAIESFKKCTQLDAWYGHGYVMLGIAYIQAERWDEAQWAFEEAAKLEPENLQAWLGIGSVMNEQQKYTAAQKAIQHGLDIAPNSAEAHYEMGRALFGLEKLPDAELEANRAIALNNDYISSHVLLANIYVAAYDAEGALAEFREALKIDPNGPQAAAIQENIGMLEKALQQAKQSSPSSATGKSGKSVRRTSPQ